MRIFAKIRQVYDRLCDRLRQEREQQARMERQLAERDSKLLGSDFGSLGP
jgi:hypothetical protein